MSAAVVETAAECAAGAQRAGVAAAGNASVINSTSAAVGSTVATCAPPYPHLNWLSPTPVGEAGGIGGGSIGDGASGGNGDSACHSLSKNSEACHR